MIRILALSTCLVGALLGEDWPGHEGGGARHNASAAAIAPADLRVVWQRSFAAVTQGDQDGPNDERRFACGRGSRNLTLHDGHLALIAADGEGIGDGWYVTVLAAADGTTRNCVEVSADVGNSRAYMWPERTVSAGADNTTGFATTYWAPDSGILFLANGGYEACYSAYDPLANAESYRGAVQAAVPAFAAHAEHAGFADSFGRTRGEQRSHQGVHRTDAGLLPWAWGPAGVYPGPDGESKHCYDHTTGLDRGDPSYYNLSGDILAGPTGLIGVGVSEGWGHSMAGTVLWFHQGTGMKCLTGPLAVDDPPAGAAPLMPFKHGGAVITADRLYCLGPAQGDPGYGKSITRGLGPIAQGLAVWAYDLDWEDRQANDRYAGPGAAESLIAELAWAHRFESTYDWDRQSAVDGGESWFEQDGFHRNKAALADEDGLFVAWKPSAADPVELVRITDAGVQRASLGIGQGQFGVDIWPHLSLTQHPESRLAYLNGSAVHRDRYVPSAEEAASVLADHEGKKWHDLDETARAQWIEREQRRGFWTAEVQEPRGASHLVIVDPETLAVRWTYDLTDQHPTLPVNEFWGYLDRTQMVAAGQWVWVAWVDTSSDGEATLRLLAFDSLTAEADPIAHAIPLGFPAADNRMSLVQDLIAADGRLYALITQSDRLHTHDPRWTHQHVIALGTE